MKVGWYNNHSRPPGYNLAAYVHQELEFKGGTPKDSGRDTSLDSKLSEEWKPIGEITNVDGVLCGRLVTNLKLYVQALKGRDGCLVKDIGDDLSHAFNEVLLRIGGDKFYISPFGVLHRKYQEITQKYTIEQKETKEMKYMGIGARL